MSMIHAGNAQFHDIINDQGLPLCVGLASIELENPTDLSVNNQGSYVMVQTES